IVQCLEDFNIPLYLSHTISKIEGQDRIERITLSQVDENLQFIKGTEKEFEVDTLLLSVGLVPSNVLLENIGTKISEVTKGPVVNEYMETSVEGIFSCGNSLHVHDLVDFVSKEARIAAKGAAKYIKNEFKRNKKQITCVAGNKVSYVLPQMINKDNIDDSVEIKFRVREPLTNKKILIKLNEEVLKEIKRPNLAPAEMQTIMVKAEEFTSDFGELSVEIIDG
ncbi:TPA: FAD-dependent oxidoreductase, partial [bacterium]|nr:FAD-dependent oxidoreductase [bacterium]